MGFDTNGVKLLIKAKSIGVNFENVITIGRQSLWLNEKEMEKLLYNDGFSIADIKEIFTGPAYFAEPFLKFLGAKKTDSMDVSEYEGATIMHDLNYPISDELKSKYTLVIDGGTLEHVFNFPVSIKNCMDLIEKGGYYIGITPANNFFGHGFYQFSPELYYRIFNPINGFRILKMYFFIDEKGASIYEVSDPLIVKERITMTNAYPTYLFVIAQKVEEKEVFKQMPVQSDYEHIFWQNKNYENVQTKVTMLTLFKKMIPVSLKIVILKIFRPSGISNTQFIKKIK